MEIKEILRKLELFNGLTEKELDKVAVICRERKLIPKEVVTSQGEYADDLFIITKGFVEVHLGEVREEKNVLVNLGEGQIIGEMALIDQGPRSATVRAGAEPTIVQIIRRQDLENICQKNARIGYIIMRNIATDLAFKLRHRNINEGGKYANI
jgi:CRP-like cAMP-binding protein